MPPPERERLFDGKTGAIGRADIRAERPREADLLADVDRQLAALGFRPVGDLVCARFPDILGRGYARAAGDTWGGLFFGLIETSFDFVTQWDAAALLTTLNARGTGDEPRKSLYVSRLPHLGFAKLGELLEQHAARRETLTARFGAPIAVKPTLQAFAEAVDRGIARQLGKE
ncbi:MAG: hypothetical protein FD180_5165 [Planctomycetota bacterium]|nr:MAG: hypothetical protein FD180_5165 [Planctomycetota bacterium]